MWRKARELRVSDGGVLFPNTRNTQNTLPVDSQEKYPYTIREVSTNFALTKIFS